MRRSAKESRPDNEANLIFEWEQVHQRSKPNQPFELVDESMRDGVQSPSVTAPSLADKLELLELVADLGIQVVDIGLPGAGKRAFDEVVALAKHITKRKLGLKVYCAARTHLGDIEPIAEAQQKAGMPIAVYTFIGSSPIRQWVEGWDIDFLVKTSSEAIDFAVREGLEVGYVTEDTTRSSPATLERLFRSAVDHGASRLVLCDTVGHATPEGTRALVAWTRNLIASMDVPHVKLDWHGHNDRGFALANSIAALEAGAHRVHGCGLGIGERVGNTPLDLLLLNLKLMGWIDNDLSQLVRYVRKVSGAMNFPVPRNYPLSGEDAFRTATGVHAAAIIKAQKRGDDWLADRVYSGVPAGEFGKEQVIEISHMSGMSNVRYWLEKYLVPPTDELCTAILQRAKNSARTLTDDEIFEVCARFTDRPEARRRVGAAG